MERDLPLDINLDWVTVELVFGALMIAFGARRKLQHVAVRTPPARRG
jgi:hypothetical protein